MFDFLNMALMGIQDPMALATQMASQNIAPEVMHQAIGSMAQPSMMGGAVAPGGTIPMPDAPRTAGTPILQQSGPGAQVAALDNGIFDSFMGAVKKHVTNPAGLAAVAGTGMRESGFSTGNAFRSWDDVGKPAGGILSWRAERLQALKRFAGTDDLTKISPEMQGNFFVQEDPSLIAKLNAAPDAGSAMQIMNNHWQFKGFDSPDNPEVKARMNVANKMMPLFSGPASPPPGDLQSRSLSNVDIPQQGPGADLTAIAGEFGGDGTNAAMAADPNAAKPQTLAEKLAAIGKGLKVPEGGSAQEPPRISGGGINVGGGFGRDPHSIEQLFALLGGGAPSQTPVPSLSQLIKGV